MRGAIGKDVLTETAIPKNRLGEVGRITSVAVGGGVAGAWDSPRSSTLPLKEIGLIGVGALQRDATVGTKREGHSGLAGRRIIGGIRRKAQGAM